MGNLLRLVVRSFATAFMISGAVLALFHLVLLAPIKHIENDRLGKYYLEFNELIHPFCKDFNINNKNLEYLATTDFDNKFVLGTCFTMGKGYILNISSVHFKGSRESDVRATIYHELTHCLLREPHSENRGSYMFSSADASLTREMLEDQVREVATRVCILKI